MEGAGTSTDNRCAVSGYLDNGRCDDKASSDMEAHLELISKEAERQRTLRKVALREKLEGLRAEFRKTLENGVDPLFVFPEEVWIMIFEHVTDLDDLASCARTCRFFQALVTCGQGENGSDVWEGKVDFFSEWMQVFPLVSNYLNRHEIKTLRQVCKHWRRAVDKCLEGYYSSVPDPPHDIVDELNNCSDLPRRVIQDFEFRHEIRNDRKWFLYRRTKQEMRRHPGNPFVGRAVAIVVGAPRHEDENLNFFLDFSRMYLEFGSYIWSVTLSDLCVSLSLSAIYSLCLQILIGCPNLKHFCVKNFRWMNWLIPKEELEMRLNAMPFPAPLEQLQSLEVLIHNRNVFLHQDKLVQMYSGQLKHLQIHVWNTKLYHYLDWGSLLELHVVHGQAVELLKSLKDMTSPNLRKLSIRLDGSKPKLASLINLTHHFPRLNHLHLKFSDEFGGFSDDEILNIPSNLIAAASLTTLEISQSDLDLCYNFLIRFPLVKQLIIVKGLAASWRHLLYEDDRTHRRRVQNDAYVEDDFDFNYDEEDLANGVGHLDVPEYESEDDSWMDLEHRVHGTEEDSSDHWATSEEEEEEDGGDEDGMEWSNDEDDLEEMNEYLWSSEEDHQEVPSEEETEGQIEILADVEEEDSFDDYDDRISEDDIRGSDDDCRRQSTSGDSENWSLEETSGSETESDLEVVKRSARLWS